jgi:hypothetical protein
LKLQEKKKESNGKQNARIRELAIKGFIEIKKSA